MIITKEEFAYWKKDPITQEVFKALQSMREMVEEQMLSDHTIAGPSGHLILNRLSGLREGIDKVLFISVEDVDNDEETSEASRVSSIGTLEENS